jgi:hypothetical protein
VELARLFRPQFRYPPDKCITYISAVRAAGRPAVSTAEDLLLVLSTPGVAAAQQICGPPRSALRTALWSLEAAVVLAATAITVHRPEGMLATRTDLQPLVCVPVIFLVGAALTPAVARRWTSFAFPLARALLGLGASAA